MGINRRPFAPQFPAMSCKEAELLYKLYVEQDKTAEELAFKSGWPIRSVFVRLKEHGISKRGYEKPYPRYCPTCSRLWKKKN